MTNILAKSRADAMWVEVARQRGDPATIEATCKHRRDDFMWTLLVKSPSQSPVRNTQVTMLSPKWIVWDYNAEAGGLFNGHYGTEKSARTEYAKRHTQHS